MVESRCQLLNHFYYDIDDLNNISSSFIMNND